MAQLLQDLRRGLFDSRKRDLNALLALDVAQRSGLPNSFQHVACNGLSPMWASVTLGQPPRKHGLANPWMKAFPLPHRTFQQHARTSTLAG
jgi:hypothetical protein